MPNAPVSMVRLIRIPACVIFLFLACAVTTAQGRANSTLPISTPPAANPAKINTASQNPPPLPAVNAGGTPDPIQFTNDAEAIQSACANIWQSNPSAVDVPAWLTTPKNPAELSAGIPSGYIAAQLIKQGAVDVAACSDGGMRADGQASACGMGAARSALTGWQAQFTGLIKTAAQGTGIPAQMLKTVFSRESRVWPGITIGQPQIGLGQLTVNGADTTLMWDYSLYESFCPTVLDRDACGRNYALLPPLEKAELQLALVNKVNHSFCKDCPLGIDIYRAAETADIFAATLKANCAQTDSIIRDIYDGAPSAHSSYADLWRFTLVNYNAGPGCLAEAVQEVKMSGEKLDWSHLSADLPAPCKGARQYVNSSSFADAKQAPGPNRYAAIFQSSAAYQWKVSSWEDRHTACLIRVNHAGAPSGEEIHSACGEDIYDTWQATKPCLSADLNAGTCTGYFLVPLRSNQGLGTTLSLPPAAAWITLDGCTPSGSNFACNQAPTLVLHGEEPLAGQSITGLRGSIDGKDFSCDAGSTCTWKLDATPASGTRLQFWANSSYGDSSDLFAAQIYVNAPNDTNGREWNASVLSDPLESCSDRPLGGAPDWLSTPQDPSGLATGAAYEYLSADLIRQGAVNVGACSDYGLMLNGLASECGQAAAQPAVNEWQNRFDSLILASAQEAGVPARLMKALFGKESQFWPGLASRQPEAGLGQLTENGADTTLLWSRSFYEAFCPTVLADSQCQLGYAGLGEAQKAQLRRTLMNSVDANCKSCAGGVDLNRAEASVAIFAQTLKASCEQSGSLLDGLYGGGNSTYADAWRFALVNYNAGPGCLASAVREMISAGDSLDWPHVSKRLTPACQGARTYVSDISGS